MQTLTQQLNEEISIYLVQKTSGICCNQSRQKTLFFSHQSGASPNQLLSEHAFPRAFTATALACELATAGRKGREGSGRGWNTLRAASPSISLERSKETARRVRLEGLKKELAGYDCLPAVGNGCMFTRTWHQLHGFLSNSLRFSALSAFSVTSQMRLY